MAGLVAANLNLDDETLTALCEKSIRNHDPCISCSAHFLTLTVDRRCSLTVVIGIGNGFRRTTGVGLAVAEDIVQRNLPRRTGGDRHR